MLAGPEPSDHTCINDQFNVHGGAPIPAICGTNSGQHSKFIILIPAICGTNSGQHSKFYYSNTCYLWH